MVALGGGALLDPHNRALVEAAGEVVCLSASLETLLDRLHASGESRPLLSDPTSSDFNNLPSAINDQKLVTLLASRAEHYGSFRLQVDVNQLSLLEATWQAQIRLGIFRVQGMGAAYDVHVRPGGLDNLGEMLRGYDLHGPVALVSDTNLAKLYAEQMLGSLHQAGYAAELLVIPAGEEFKTLATIQQLWSGFLDAGLERASTVLALGGGVVGDLAGFAAASYLRGVRWVVLPTTLVAMNDASLGGKTGADLPQGKNLVGAFHPPALVLADPAVLRSLPQAEFRSGLAEVVKHGIIGDSRLFELCAQGWKSVLGNIEEIICRGMAVKIRIIQADPFEQGQRAALNLGHTLGHALELASNYQIRHGEGVAIGMVAAALLSERLGLAEPGLAERIQSVLISLGLPVTVPTGLDRERIIAAMGLDKKRRAGKVRLALPIRIGEVRVGVAIDDLSDLIG